MIDLLTLLREANVSRQREWDPERKLSLSFKGNELAGETGEACNVIKKLEREALGLVGSRDTDAHLGEELADIVIVADLIASMRGISLQDAIVNKFNATSEKNGLKTRIVR
jgi:NTP pyrophosphatase (non-canonical NTP hydrolase)